MSKSNNNHFTPDLFGEQKGDSSPFFHTPDKEEWLSLLLKERKDISFFTEEDLISLSTFFHKEKCKVFLREATTARERRHALADEIQATILALSEEVAALARIFSAPQAEGVLLSKSCATLAESVEKQEDHIRTNIIFWINNIIISTGEDNTFFQIKKELFLMETVQKALNSLPSDWENVRRELLSYPPDEQIHMLSEAVECYNTLQAHLASTLLSAAKAAKAESFEKYANILHKTTVYLYDMAALLKAIKRKEA